MKALLIILIMSLISIEASARTSDDINNEARTKGCRSLDKPYRVIDSLADPSLIEYFKHVKETCGNSVSSDKSAELKQRIGACDSSALKDDQKARCRAEAAFAVATGGELENGKKRFKSEGGSAPSADTVAGTDTPTTTTPTTSSYSNPSSDPFYSSSSGGYQQTAGLVESQGPGSMAAQSHAAH